MNVELATTVLCAVVGLALAGLVGVCVWMVTDQREV